jgi:hypothetical protein
VIYFTYFVSCQGAKLLGRRGSARRESISKSAAIRYLQTIKTTNLRAQVVYHLRDIEKAGLSTVADVIATLRPAVLCGEVSAK